MSKAPSFALQNTKLNIAMVAGEESGDLLASLLLKGVAQRWQSIYAHGIGGEHMQRQGFIAHWPSELLSVHGFSLEVLRRAWGIWQVRNKLKRKLLVNKPDIFIGVDAPDFNFGLEADLRAQGVPTVHFVCPSIWAWRAHRVKTIRRCADHVLCLFPFEPELLHQHGIDATYVGHPLSNILPMQPDKSAARDKLNLPEEGQILALLPGSRNSEIHYLMPRLLQSVRILQQQKPNLYYILPAVTAQYTKIVHMVRQAGLQHCIKVLQGQSHVALTACDVALIASGTATLEAALLKRPMVITYAMHPLSASMFGGKKLQPWVGLPNILSREFVVPELLQEDATPQKLAHATAAWFDNPEKVSIVQNRFTELHHSLKRDTATIAANAIKKVLTS